MMKGPVGIAVVACIFSSTLPALAQVEQWEALDPIPAPPIPGMATWPSGGSLCAGPNGTLYTLRTCDMPDVRELWRYLIDAQQWALMPAKPPYWAYNGKLTWDGQDKIYSIGDDFISPGVDATGLMMYGVGQGQWQGTSPAAGVPHTFLYGPVVWGGNDRLYISGMWSQNPGSYWYFRRYTPSTGQWQAMATPTYLVSEDAAMACPGAGDLIFLMQADDEWQVAAPNRFQVYSQSLNQWNPASAGGDPPDCPAAIGSGAALCCPAPYDVIYAFPGNGTGFWAYTIATKTWTSKPPTPLSVGKNSGIAWPGYGSTLYAVRGAYTGDFWRYRMTDHVPSVPALPKQYAVDGHELAVGEMTKTGPVTIRATVTDAEAGYVRLAVEMKPLGTGFNHAAVISAAVPSGSIATVTIDGLAYGGDYHWCAWTIDDANQESAPVSYGANGEGAADVRIQAETAPVPGTLLASDGATGAPISWGSTIFDTTPLVFYSTVNDAEDDDSALQVAFSTQPSVTGPFGPKAAGVSVGVSLPPGTVQVQSRCLDVRGAASPWTAAGSLTIIPGGSAGMSRCTPFDAGASGTWLLAGLAVLLLRRRC